MQLLKKINNYKLPNDREALQISYLKNNNLLIWEFSSLPCSIIQLIVYNGNRFPVKLATPSDSCVTLQEIMYMTLS